MKILVLDTETANLKRGIVDIAIACIDEDFRVLWKIESLIDPECEISPEAMGVHHITPEMVWDKPTIEEFMNGENYPFADVDVVCGHNVQFDIRFIKEYMPESYRVIDTLKLSRSLWPQAESHKLQTLRYTFALEAGNAHRAMGDVITTISLMRLLAEEHGTDAQGLLQLMNAPLSLETKMPFGKHKGESLRSLPLNYVRWLVDKAEIDGDLRDALVSRL